MITGRGVEILFLIFLRIDVSMQLGPVCLLDMRHCIKSDISSGVVGVMKKDSAFVFLMLLEKFIFVGGMCFWSTFFINVKYSLKCSAISLALSFVVCSSVVWEDNLVPMP